MIEVEPLTRAHLAAFEPETPLPGQIPEDQFGKAAVGVKDGKPLAICLIIDRDGVAEVGLTMSAEARRHPVSAVRLARSLLAGLHAQGYACIRTVTEDARATRWLLHLGFQDKDGVFEKWV